MERCQNRFLFMTIHTSVVRLGAIDAGSNALRLKIVEARSLSAFRVIAAERLPVRLGHRVFIDGTLSRATIRQAVGAFQKFQTLLREHRVDSYRAVGTSAVRTARNQRRLLRQIYDRTGIPLVPLTRQEETEVIRRAVMQALPPNTHPPLVMDLGGGSLELNLQTDSGLRQWCISIGTVRLMETHNARGRIFQRKRRILESEIRSRLEDAFFNSMSHFPDLSGSITVACGGNAEAYASLFPGRREQGVNTVDVGALREALGRLLPMPIVRRMKTYDVLRDRAEVMPMAGLVFAILCEQLKIDRFLVPGVGVREGLLLEMAQQHFR